MKMKEALKDERVLKKLIQVEMKILSSKIKMEATKAYQREKEILIRRVLIFFSGTFITFFLNYTVFKELTGEGALLWSNVFFAVSVFLMFLKYLSNATGRVIQKGMFSVLDDVLAIYEKFVDLGAEPSRIKDAFVNHAKDIPAVSKFLNDMSMDLKENIDTHELSEEIDRFLYSGEKKGGIIDEVLDSKGETMGEFTMNKVERLFKDAWSLKFPVLFYFVAIGIFMTSFFVKKWKIMFSYLQ